MTRYDDMTPRAARLSAAIAAQSWLGERPRLAERTAAGIDLAGAEIDDLETVGMDLAGAEIAELREAGIDLRGVTIDDPVVAEIDLRGERLDERRKARIYLRRETTHPHVAHAAGIDLRGPDTPSIPDIHRVVRDAVGAEGERLDMAAWHSDCGTVHCIAGRVVTLAGAAGEAEVARQSSCIDWAAAAIYQASDPPLTNLPPMMATTPRAEALAALDALAEG